MSMGVNNIPPKLCSYSCVYCQLGITPRERTERSSFYSPEYVIEAAKQRLEKVLSQKWNVDYITFVPDGEPTLDENLGKEIVGLRETGFKIAVITNSSLLWMEDVRSDLMNADWVSLKVDTVDEQLWKTINRPSEDLSLSMVLEGVRQFSSEFKGNLATETMLVSSINDGPNELEATASFISGIEPHTAYISIPTRPPAEVWVKPPDEEVVNEAYQIFRGLLERVECITGYEGNLFTYTDDVQEDILGITSVHPMRKEGLMEMLSKSGKDWGVVEGMISRGILKEVEYNGTKFYLKSQGIQEK